MDGKPDLFLVNTSKHGLAVHLLYSADRTEPRKALCGVRARYREQWSSFELLGCKRCANKALQLGYTRVPDIDDEYVDLTIVANRQTPLT